MTHGRANDSVPLSGSAFSVEPPASTPSGQAPRSSSNDSNGWITRAIWLFVALGLSMRVLRYLLRFPLWGDESALAANLLERGYLDLLKPLDYQQVAPPLFMWIELWVTQQLGFHEWSLRAFPFACSLGSVLLFRHVARLIFCDVTLNQWRHADGNRTLCRRFHTNECGDESPDFKLAPLLAVAIFSVSYYPLRHGVEAKQYASDLFVSLSLLALSLGWVRNPQRAVLLWFLAAAGPIALALSHPAAFVSGGIGLALLPIVWRCRTRRLWAPFLAYSAALIIAFSAIYLISTKPQIAAADDEGIMRSYWAQSFPPITRPLQLVVWFFTIHAGQLFAYPAGGADLGSGIVTFACFVIGIVLFGRTERRSILLLCLAPFALTLSAAAFKRYPYGGYARTSQHLAPMICLFAAAGMARVICWFRHDRARLRFQFAFLGTLAMFAAGIMVQDVICPYRTEHDRRVREFARWFWHDKGIGAELVCTRADLRQTFFRQTYLWRGIAQYLCNQRIYSWRDQRAGRQPDWAAISHEHPLRCVVFSRPGLSRDEAAFSSWLESVQDRFAWVGYERNDFHKPHEHGPDIERVEVFEFVPKDDATIDASRSPRYAVPRTVDLRAN
jgi:hypothetical protein